jgi:hypothetical protein
MWWGAPVFYIVNRSHSVIEFDLNSNRFTNYKRLGNEKGFLFSNMAMGRNLLPPWKWPTRPNSYLAQDGLAAGPVAVATVWTQRRAPVAADARTYDGPLLASHLEPPTCAKPPGHPTAHTLCSCRPGLVSRFVKTSEWRNETVVQSKLNQILK